MTKVVHSWQIEKQAEETYGKRVKELSKELRELKALVEKQAELLKKLTSENAIIEVESEEVK